MKSIYHIKRLNYKINSKQLFDVIDLVINEKDVIHLTGDSGEGKSLLGMSLIGFFSTQSEVDYEIDVQDVNCLDIIHLRKKSIGYIFQQPKAYFNPILTCGDQLLELVENQSPEQAKKIILKACKELCLEAPESIFAKYPHEFSIGQLQRIYVVSTLIRNPKLIIADEPFAHLDWKTAKIVAETLINYVRLNSAALLVISHEQPGSLLIPNRIWKLKNGHVEEIPFEQGNSINKVEQTSNKKHIGQNSILKISGVGKKYRRKFTFNAENQDSWALKNINFEIKAGERLGVMGASGSGKTTLALIICGLIQATSGDVIGRVTTNFSLKTLWSRLPASVQLVFQDPFSSFNGAQPVFEQIIKNSDDKKVIQLMKSFGLKEHLVHQDAMTLSGGELQRMAIIRALTVSPEPKLLILDEALSALDDITRQNILQFLNQNYPEMSLLFISHRYQRLKELCHRVHFIHEGQVIYTADADEENWDQAPKMALELTGQV